MTALKTRKVELSNGYLPMLWVLPDLTIADQVEKFECLKENFGLTQSRLVTVVAWRGNNFKNIQVCRTK